jgi:type IV pilus assembly protein PilE
MRGKQHGFTLIEILITVAVVAILAAIALPQYGQYVTRAALPEAHAGLGAFRVLMEQYYQDNRNYGTGGCGVAAPGYKNFTHGCALTNADQGSRATATGVTGTRAEGFTFQIDHTNARSTPNVPTGWVNSTTCFVTKKTGDC